MSEAKSMKIVQGFLLAVLAGLFVIGSLLQIIGGGLTETADELFGRVEVW